MFAALRPATASCVRAARVAVAPSLSRAAFRPAQVVYRFASTKSYTEDHEWIQYDSDTKIGIVGITEYAQKALGDVVFVELPAVDTEVAQKDQIGAVESVKAASDIFAPVSGKVTEINDKLGDQPSLLNHSPETEGWLCKISLSKADELGALMDEQAYKAHCEGQD